MSILNEPIKINLSTEKSYFWIIFITFSMILFGGFSGLAEEGDLMFLFTAFSSLTGLLIELLLDILKIKTPSAIKKVGYAIIISALIFLSFIYFILISLKDSLLKDLLLFIVFVTTTVGISCFLRNKIDISKISTR